MATSFHFFPVLARKAFSKMMRESVSRSCRSSALSASRAAKAALREASKKLSPWSLSLPEAGGLPLIFDRYAEVTGAAMSVDGVAAVPFAYQLAVPVFSKLDSHGLILLKGHLLCKVKQRGTLCHFPFAKSRGKIHKNRHKHSARYFRGL